MKIQEPILAVEGVFLWVCRNIFPIRQQAPRLCVVGKIDGQDIIPNIPYLLGVFDWKHHLHPSVDIPRHQIRTAEINLFVAAILKIIDSAVLQKTAYHADDADVVT